MPKVAKTRSPTKRREAQTKQAQKYLRRPYQRKTTKLWIKETKFPRD